MMKRQALNETWTDWLKSLQTIKEQHMSKMEKAFCLDIPFDQPNAIFLRLRARCLSSRAKRSVCKLESRSSAMIRNYGQLMILVWQLMLQKYWSLLLIA